MYIRGLPPGVVRRVGDIVDICVGVCGCGVVYHICGGLFGMVCDCRQHEAC